jgi:hypothetical protein
MAGVRSGEATRHVQSSYAFYYRSIHYVHRPSEWKFQLFNFRKFWEMEHFGIVDPYAGAKEPDPLANFGDSIQRIQRLLSASTLAY